MSASPRSARALISSAGAALVLSAGCLVALAVPSLGATTTTSSGPTQTTSAPATTSRSSTGTGTTSSTSCYHAPSPTSLPVGTVVKSFDFEDGSTSGFFGSPGVTLANTTEAAHSGSHALRADGLTSSSSVNTSFSSPSWGSFQLTAWVRLPAGSPPTRITMMPSGASVLASADRATPITWTSLTGRAAPSTVYADWYCNGRMTGTTYPASISLRFQVDTACAPGPYASGLILDDVAMTVLTSNTSSTSSGGGTVTPGCPVGTTTTTTTSTTTTTTTTGGTAGCQVHYRIDGQWPGGYIAAVNVVNTGTGTIVDWAVSWTFPDDQRIVSFWQAAYAQTGRDVTVRRVTAWTGALPPGGSASFGFISNTATAPQAPTAFTLNGQACSTV